MKLVIVLFAVVAAASAYPGHIPWAAPVVSQPWQAPAWQPAASVWPSQPWPAPAWPVQQPAKVAYVKVAQPVAYAKVHAPSVHHVLQVPQQPAIPPPHPSPLTLKVHAQSVRIPLHPAHPGHPHLVGYEAHVPEPEVKIVKPVHHSW